MTSLPCYVMLVDGQEVDRVAESTSFSRLERMCQMGARATPPGEPAATAAEPSGQGTRPQNAFPADRPQSPQPTPFGPIGRGDGQMPIGPSAEPGPQPDAQPVKSFGDPMPTNPPPEPQTRAVALSSADLIAVSVRLRVQDKDGRSCGSGTIIDNRDGEALVLTCGHLFRDAQGKGAISVDLFNTGMPQTVPGRLIFYSAPQSGLDLSPDVGLVAIRCPGPVVIARLAPRDYRVKEGTAVVSVGCNNGDLPTARPSQVTRLNRFNGPPNIEVAGQPVEGRSGGGLFSPEGYVIGICNAADPEDREGYFGATASVYAELDREKLASVYQSPAGRAIGTLTSGLSGGPLPENGAELGNVAAGMLAPVLHGMLSAPIVRGAPQSSIASSTPDIAMVPNGFTGPPAEAAVGPLLPAPSGPTMPPAGAEDAQRSLLSAPSAASAAGRRPVGPSQGQQGLAT